MAQRPVVPAGRGRVRGRAGFTLVEVLLALVIVGLLAGALVFNSDSLSRGARLDEGAARFESLLRFARAQAANTGRQVRITFDEQTGDGVTRPEGGLRVLWEPDPLGAPGLFQELPETMELVRSLEDLVRIQVVRNEPETGSDPVPEPEADGTAAVAIPSVSFFPDGSSDSIDVVLGSQDLEDPRRIRVRLVGLTGSIRRQWLDRERDLDPETEGRTGAVERVEAVLEKAAEATP